MHILITGSRGYIGSHLISALSGDIHVTEVDIAHPSQALDIKNLPIFHREYDCVIHLAALVRVNESMQCPSKYYATNVQGTIEVLNKIRTKNLIFASTGAASTMTSPYAISKHMAEDIIQEYCQINSVPYTIFRFYNVIGSKGYAATNPDGLMSNLVRSLYTGVFTIHGNDYPTPDGTALRDYVHVMEIVEAIQRAMLIPANSIQNLGHAEGVSVLQMAQKFRELNNAGYEIEFAPRREGDAAISVLDKPSVYLQRLYSIDEMLTLPNSK